jgi:hypothetical protein
LGGGGGGDEGDETDVGGEIAGGDKGDDAVTPPHADKKDKSAQANPTANHRDQGGDNGRAGAKAIGSPVVVLRET